jgi:hypothetical protein
VVRSEVTAAVYRALADAGIPIAPPGRAVQITMEDLPPSPAGT